VAQSVYFRQLEGSSKIEFASIARNDKFTHQVIKQLALAHLKVPEKTSFIFHYNYGVSLGFGKFGKMAVSVSLMPEICTGDVMVRGFDVQSLLVPSSCDLRILVNNAVEGEIYRSEVQNVSLSGLLAGDVYAEFPDSLWKQGNTIIAGFSNFRFDETGYLKLEQELTAIRDYDAAADLADTLENLVRKARVKKHNIKDAFSLFSTCTKGRAMLLQSVRANTRIVPGNDPRNLAGIIPVVVFQIDDLNSYLMNQGLVQGLTGNIYTGVRDGYLQSLKTGLQLSQHSGYYSSPFYYRLFAGSFHAGYLWHALKQINGFAKTNNLSLNQRLLSDAFVEAYLIEGKVLAAEGRYAEAVDLLSSGLQFAGVNPFIGDKNKLKIMLADVRRGLTGSYVRIVRKALDNNLPALADKYLNEAMLFLSKDAENADTLVFSELFAILSGKNLVAGERLLASGDYDLALAEFERAESISIRFHIESVRLQAAQGVTSAVSGIYSLKLRELHSAINQNLPDLADKHLEAVGQLATDYTAFKPDWFALDSLNRQIGLLRFSQSLDRAGKYSHEYKSDSAVSEMLTSATLIRKYNLPQSNLFDTLVSTVIFPRIRSLISEGRLKLWAGEPEPALNLAGEAQTMIQTFNLQHKRALATDYKDLLEIAEASVCSKVKGQLASLLNQIDDSYAANQFDLAEDKVFIARELIFSKAACGLSTTGLNEIRQKYEPRIQWHMLMKQADEKINAGEFLPGIESLQQAGAVFSYFRLDTLGLANTGLYEMAMKSYNLPLISYATGYYIARRGFDRAFELVKRMHALDVPVEQVTDFQESLGRALALRDLAEIDSPDIKKLLKAYTGGDKWYKRFAEVYRFHFMNP